MLTIGYTLVPYDSALKKGEGCIMVFIGIWLEWKILYFSGDYCSYPHLV